MRGKLVQPPGCVKEQEAQAALVASDDEGASAAADPAEERYNVVYRNAQGRFVVGGAAARVFVQGVGAAFTVFLAGKAGTRLLASDEVSPHPFGLLLFCFVGAVFAEEIWKSAAHLLRTRTAQPGAAATNGG